MRLKEHDAFLKMVGATVRKIRIDKKITMETLAHESGIDFRQIGRIERGETNTTILSLYRLSQILEIDMREFFIPE